ncbi:MAG TPA: RsmE family RNA methyltransferase [Candidatus Binataceae bacterium]|nr:RsmE family RNA methyltransferase [Candidatus Binataceae bacterium]
MKRAARFVISSAAVKGAVALVGGAELHHMRDVMRLRAGAQVALFDEHGAQYAGTIRNYHSDHAIVEIAAAPRAREDALAGVILAASVIKGSRMDFLVEKAAELGAAELWPVLPARGVVREVGGERLARWRRLATAAAKQSLAPRTTEVLAPLTLGDLIRRGDGGRLCVVLSAGAPPLGPIVRAARERAILLLCGPEGDFTDEELAAMHAAGFVAAGLGGRRLRSETAALAALSIATGARDELYGAAGGED